MTAKTKQTREQSANHRPWRLTTRIALHLTLACACLSFTLLVRSELRQRYTSEQQRIEQEGRTRRAAELAGNWNRLKYLAISSSDFQDRFYALTNWAPLSSLSDLQRERFFRRLAETIDYLEEPTVDRYLRLKTNDLRPRFELSAGARQVLTSRKQPVPAELPQSPDGAVARLWTAVAAKDGFSEPWPHLTAINLERLRAAAVRTNTTASALSTQTALGMTMLRGAMDTGFRYGPTATNQTGSDRVTLAQVSFFARSSSSSNAAPVYLSFSWSEEDRDWAPQQLLSDVLLNIDPLF
jgi:hypothetical protein